RRGCDQHPAPGPAQNGAWHRTARAPEAGPDALPNIASRDMSLMQCGQCPHGCGRDYRPGDLVSSIEMTSSDAATPERAPTVPSTETKIATPALRSWQAVEPPGMVRTGTIPPARRATSHPAGGAASV